MATNTNGIDRSKLLIKALKTTASSSYHYTKMPFGPNFISVFSDLPVVRLATDNGIDKVVTVESRHPGDRQIVRILTCVYCSAIDIFRNAVVCPTRTG